MQSICLISYTVLDKCFEILCTCDLATSYMFVFDEIIRRNIQNQILFAAMAAIYRRPEISSKQMNQITLYFKNSWQGNKPESAEVPSGMWPSKNVTRSLSNPECYHDGPMFSIFQAFQNVGKSEILTQSNLMRDCTWCLLSRSCAYPHNR